MTTISVVVPTLDEEEELPGCLESVRRQRPAAHELIVADGGSTDLTLERARDALVVRSARGRGRQLNRGAERASGDVLLFLHADTRLPNGALAAAADCLADPSVAAGAFHKRFRSSSALLRHARWRTALWHRFGAVFGDQALFIRRRDFLELGGFREDLAAEDAELVRRAASLGAVRLLTLEVETSARRLQRDGAVPTWLRWWRTWAVELVRTRFSGS